MIRKVLLGGIGALLVCACGRGPTPPPYRPIADVKQLMHALDAEADALWEATGWIDTAEGTVERRPKNEEEWEHVRASAIMLTEAGNLLMMPPRAKDGGEWMKRSQELIDIGQRAWRAAEAKNVQQLFTVGGEVYDACSHCHQQYMEAIVNANK